MIELPNVEKPATFSEADVLGNCPMVMLKVDRYWKVGWLVSVTGDHAELMSVLHEEEGMPSWRESIKREAISSVRILQDQLPSMEVRGNA